MRNGGDQQHRSNMCLEGGRSLTVCDDDCREVTVEANGVMQNSKAINKCGSGSRGNGGLLAALGAWQTWTMCWLESEDSDDCGPR